MPAAGFPVFSASDRRKSSTDGEGCRGLGEAAGGGLVAERGWGDKCYENGRRNEGPVNPDLAGDALPLRALHAGPGFTPR
ncbi:hypothetical protein GCM10027440_13880 [Nocardiopsis coralliicola]